MTIMDLKETVEMLQLANNAKYALMGEVAKELKVSKTALTKFLVDNPKLVYTEGIWSYKDVTVKRRLWPGQNTFYKSKERVKGRSLGMGIVSVYLTPDKNYRTEEWLQRQIKSMAKYIEITEWSNYGWIEGYFVSLDVKKEDDEFRKYAWRNTSEKIEWLKVNGFLHPYTFTMGGFGDCSSTKIDTAIHSDDIEKLKQLGWTTNKLTPLSTYNTH